LQIFCKFDNFIAVCVDIISGVGSRAQPPETNGGMGGRFHRTTNFKICFQIKSFIYREAESYVSHNQTKQASMHAPRFGTQSKQSSKQTF